MEKLIETALNYGLAGLVIALVSFFAWKLADKWLSKLVAAQEKQADAMTMQAKSMGEQAQAMTALAQSVTTSQGGQTEVLMATRVISRTLEEMKGWIKELDEHVRERETR